MRDAGLDNRGMRLHLAALVLLTALAAGCGGGRSGGDTAATTAGPASDLSGTIQADGSSTVGPFATAAAERFQRENPDVRITVGVFGTGGGFERFCPARPTSRTPLGRSRTTSGGSGRTS